MSMFASEVERWHKGYLRTNAKDLKALAEVRRSEDLTEDARQKKAQEIRDRLEKSYAKHLHEARKLAEGAAEAYLAHSPAGIGLRAAVDKPARSVEVRRLAEGASADELVALAKILAEKEDAAGAYGLRTALTRSTQADMSDGVRGDILRTLDTIKATDARRYLTDLVACNRLLMFLELGGVEGTATITDPLKAMQAEERSRCIPLDAHGVTRTLSTTEADALVAEAGFDVKPPSRDAA